MKPITQTRYCLINKHTKKVVTDYRRSRQDLLKLMKGKDYFELVTLTFKDGEIVSVFPDYPKDLFKV